jgi:protein-tyrosine phosphatase
MTSKNKILFVCLGNICRSPTAQGVFEKFVEQKKLQDKFEIDSAGTAAYHIGSQPDARSIKHAEKRGYKLHHQRARKVDFADFMHYDYILAMDNSNYEDLKDFAPKDYHKKIHLLLEFADKDLLKKINNVSTEVPDPYYSGADGFEKVLDLIENTCGSFLKKFG